jgi:hypothetical protein
MWGTKVGSVRRVAAGAALATALAAGCAQEATLDLTATDGGVLANELLALAADRSSAEAYRFETDVTTWAMGTDAGDEENFGVTVTTTGEVDGDDQSSLTDMSGSFEGVPGNPMGGLDPNDLVVETVVVDDTMYVRAPIFGAMFNEMAGPGDELDDLGPFGAFGDIGDGWGHIDLEELPGELSPGDMTGAAGLDAATGLDLLGDAADQRSLGSDEIRGVPVEGYATTVTMEDLMVATGGDVEDLDEELPPGVIDDDVDVMLGIEIAVEAWLDGDGLVRRLVVDVDLADLMRLEPGAPQDMPSSLRMRSTTDLFDFGDESIVIEAPSGSVDITEAFRDMAEESLPIDGGVITS